MPRISAEADIPAKMILRCLVESWVFRSAGWALAETCFTWIFQLIRILLGCLLFIIQIKTPDS